MLLFSPRKTRVLGPVILIAERSAQLEGGEEGKEGEGRGLDKGRGEQGGKFCGGQSG